MKSNLVATCACIFIALVTTSQAQTFTNWGSDFSGNAGQAAAIADFDNDGRPDVAFTGAYYINGNIFRNNGDSTFTSTVSLLPLRIFSYGAWADFNNDGLLDIAVAGFNDPAGNVDQAKIFRNNGDNTFTDIGAGLSGVHLAALAWGDYNNDGDPDLFISGFSGGNSARLYRNNGNETFTEVSAGFVGVNGGKAVWADFDNDHDLDLVYNGYNTTQRTYYYRNDGEGAFSEVSSGLPNVYNGALSVGDFDLDGSPDLLLSGNTSSSSITVVYRNDGAGNFSQVANLGLALGFSDGSWGDMDNDGDPDIVIGGSDAVSTRSSRVFRNNGDDTFTDIGASLTAVAGIPNHSTFLWADVNSDQRLDLFISGNDGSADVASVYLNDSTFTPTAPTPPETTSAIASGSSVTLSWTEGSDAETPAAGLMYNLRIGTTASGIDILSPMADVSTGVRRIFGIGNAGTDTLWTIKDLASGTYYWSVQAIDAGGLASAFSAIDTFIVDNPAVFDSAYAVQISSSLLPGIAHANVEVLNLVLTVSGDAGALSVSSLHFNTNGTTDTSDLSSAKVYYTGSSNVFSTTTSFGSAVNYPGDNFSVSGSQVLGEGANNFWLVYDVSSATSAGDFLDAEFDSASIDTFSIIPSIGDPAGTVVFEALDVNAGSALTFNGTTQYVNVGRSDLGLTTGFSVEAWIKVTAFTQSWQSIVTKGDNAWRIHRNSGTNVVGFGTTGLSNTDLAGTTNVNDGQWHHIAAIYTGTEKLLYVDGNLDASVSVTGTLSTNAYDIRIGSNAQMADRIWNGSMDEVRIWNVARSAAEIRGNAHHALSGLETGLVAYFQFNEGTGESATDFVGDNNGTLVNGPTWPASTIPLGPGASVGTTLTSSSTETNIGGVGLTMTDTFDGDTYLAVARIDETPNVIPMNQTTTLGDRYYIVRPYDGAGEFGAQLSFELSGATFDTLDASMPERVRLYRRDATSTGTWSFVGGAVSVDTISQVVTFNSSMSTFGQLVIVEGATTEPDSLPGSALQFNGSSSYVDLGSDPASISGQSSITVEAWVKPSAFTDVARVIEKEDEWYFYEGSNEFRFTIHGATGSPNYVASGALSANQWYHLAATYSGTEFKIYVNGELKGTKSWSGGMLNSAYPLTLGARRSAGGAATNFFTGMIDEVRIWSVVRTEQEIRESMHSTLSPPQSGLLSYWQLNENANSAAGDAFGGVDGTLQSSPTWSSSTAPVGNANVYSATIATTDASKELGSLQLTITDGFDSNTDVTASQIPFAPNVIPGTAANVLGSRYFIINTFGTPGTFGAKLTMQYTGATFDPLAEAMPHGVKLYSRSSTSDGAWTYVGGATSVNATTGEVVFDTVLTSFSQFAVIEDPSILPVQMSSFTAAASGLSARLQWSTSTEVDNSGWEIERRNVGIVEKWNGAANSPPDRTDHGNMSVVRAGNNPTFQNSVNSASWTTIGFVEGVGMSSSAREYSFSDTPPAGRYAYRLKQVDRSGAFRHTYEVEVEVGSVPKEFTLSQNYPNPFNPSTTVAFSVEADGPVALKVFDLLGREVATLFEGEAQAGRLVKAQFDARSLSTGVYVYRIEANGRSLVRRMTLVK